MTDMMLRYQLVLVLVLSIGVVGWLAGFLWEGRSVGRDYGLKLGGFFRSGTRLRALVTVYVTCFAFLRTLERGLRTL